jgi:hypothetical protein
MSSDPMNASERNRQPVQFQKARQCGARTKSGKPCRSPATKKGRCRLHGGASGSGGPPGKRNGQYRHGERTKAAMAEQHKFSALLKMLRWPDLNTSTDCRGVRMAARRRGRLQRVRSQPAMRDTALAEEALPGPLVAALHAKRP